MKQKRTKKAIAILVSSTFIVASVPSVSFAQNKYQSEIDRIKKKRSEVNAKTNATNEKIKGLKQDQSEVLAELNKLDAKMKDTKQQINQTKTDVETGKKQINQLKKEIAFIQKRIEVRQDLLKDRMRSLQKTGGMVSYVDVILGSNSFGDLVQRMSAVQVIMKADEDIIKQQNEDLTTVNNKKNETVVKQAKIERDLANLEDLKGQLSSQVKEKNSLMASLKSQQHEAEKDVLSLQEQDELLASQQSAMQKALEEAKKRAAEEVKKRAEEEAAKNNQNNDSNNSNSSGSDDQAPVSSGKFIRPAAGYISSGFGQRSFEGGEFHPGVDIASGGTVPVHAAADGVVIRAYQSSSYGNVVFITHNIDGQVWTTVYAHLNSFSVTTGQYVEQGKQIGYMGNSGHSTGQHLHFELHKGEWNINKTNAVDPQKYINF